MRKILYLIYFWQNRNQLIDLTVLINYLFILERFNLKKLVQIWQNLKNKMSKVVKTELTNPWNIHSFFELQYWICPTCSYKNRSKQEMVNHAYEYHPESVYFLNNINDNSLTGIYWLHNKKFDEVLLQKQFRLGLFSISSAHSIEI